jgi:hypothetical protein
MQTIRNTPWGIRKIPSWAKRMLPDGTGVLNAIQAEKINFSQILPITAMFSGGIGIALGLISLLFFGISPESLVIAGVLSVSILLMVGLTTFTTPVTKIPLGWVGVVTFLGTPIHIILTAGEYKFWMPKRFLGKSLLEIIIVPTINETQDVKPSKDEPPTSGDRIPLKGEITYTYEGLDMVALAPYLRKIPSYDEEGAEKSLEGMKRRLDDLIRATIFKISKQLSYEEIITSQMVGDKKENRLNNVYWDELRKDRKIWRICRYKGETIPETAKIPHSQEDLGYEIKEGDVIVMQGEYIKPLRPEDQKFWESLLIGNGEHLFFPEWGVVINNSWVQSLISIDPKIHEAFMSKIMKTQEGLGAVASAEAYTKSVLAVSGYPTMKKLRANDDEAKKAHKQAISEVQVLTGKKAVKESTVGLTDETLSSDFLSKLAVAIGKKFLS